MTVYLYTTSDAIRAVLGLSDVELSDTLITNLRMEDLLLEALEEVLPTHETVASEGASAYATAEQLTALRRLRLFCQYQAAVELLPQFQNIVAQKITDADAEMQRFAKDDLETTKDQIRGQRDKYRALLNSDYNTTALALSPVVASTPDYDPVTDT